MTDNYTPQVGDLVRRTFPNGTTMQGTIDRIGPEVGEDSWGNILYSTYIPEKTELIDRPIKFKNDVGTCYRHPGGHRFVVVKVDNDPEGLNWLGYLPGRGDRWCTDAEIGAKVREEGWVEYPLTSG